jgi:hypothetical protein
MLEYPIYIKLTFFLLLFVIIIGPEMVIPGLQLFIMTLQILITKLEYLFLMTIVRIYNAFPSKKSLGIGLFTHVNHALVATYSDESEKYLTSIGHRAFCEKLLIVEEYENNITAKAGHEKWIKTFEKGLPNKLKDVTNNTTYKREFVK